MVCYWSATMVVGGCAVLRWSGSTDDPVVDVDDGVAVVNVTVPASIVLDAVGRRHLLRDRVVR
jgi:hypothetical protein